MNQPSYAKCIFRTNKRPVLCSFDDALSCVQCRSSFIWFWRWKYRCEACGEIVCSSCSNNFEKMPIGFGYNTGLFRLCDICFRIHGAMLKSDSTLLPPRDNSVVTQTEPLSKSEVKLINSTSPLSTQEVQSVISQAVEDVNATPKSSPTSSPKSSPIQPSDDSLNNTLPVSQPIQASLPVALPSQRKTPAQATLRLASSSLRGTLSRSQGAKLASAIASAKESGDVDELGNPKIDLSQFENVGLDDVTNNSARSRMMSMRSRDPKTVRPALTSSTFQSPPADVEPTTEDIINTGRNASRVFCVDIFNAIWAMNAPVVIDVRAKANYENGHIPRAISLPLSADDISSGLSLKEMSERIIPKDLRTFNTRRMRQFIICGEDPHNSNVNSPSSASPVHIEKDVNAVASQFWNSSSATSGTISVYSKDIDTPVLYLAGLLLNEKLATNVDVLAGGVSTYLQHYPQVTCIHTESEKETSNHVHIKSFPAFPSEIIDSAIYLGTEGDSSSKEQLNKLNITHILNVSRENPNHFEDTLKYCQIDIDDVATQPLSTYFETAFSFLDEALCSEHQSKSEDGVTQQSRVLVHCQMGVSRSATIVIAYIMRHFGCSLLQAIAMVRSRRPQVLPNRGFLKQLAEYETTLLPDQPSTYKDCFQVLYPGDAI